ncbi:hypothetical protein ACFLXO_05910 [Chloroflexota bacterium]
MATHPIRVLSIGLHGLPNGENSDFAGANVLQDYDAVVVRAASIETLFEGFGIKYRNEEKLILDSEKGEFLIRQSWKRSIEVQGLLEKGGVVITFMAPIIRYSWQDGGDITIYDWLFSRQEINGELGISYGTGKTIDNLLKNHPLYEYLKLKPHWGVYSDIATATKHGWQILASAYGSHALSLAKQVRNGHIILIPSDYSSEHGGILENCIQSILKIDVPSPKPDWVKNIVVPGQEVLQPKLNKINQSIKGLKRESQQVTSDIEQLEKWKYLLYEKGEHHLQPIVRDALSIIGFQDKSDIEQIADGFFSCEYGDGILEVEGSKDTIKIEKISQLIKDRANYIEDKKITSPKGILVGNPFREEPLDNRPPKGSNKSLFTKELVTTAEKQDIVVISSSDLYNIVSLILESKMSPDQKQSLRKHIFESTGLIKLV